jgi:hypothetical protein
MLILCLFFFIIFLGIEFNLIILDTFGGQVMGKPIIFTTSSNLGVNWTDARIIPTVETNTSSAIETPSIATAGPGVVLVAYTNNNNLSGSLCAYFPQISFVKSVDSGATWYVDCVY